MQHKFKIFGWANSQLDQISRIKEGLLNEGQLLDDENPDIVYSNNDMYDDILYFASQQNKKPKIILNVLDLQLNNSYQEYNNTTLIANSSIILEVIYEAYLIEKMFLYISGKGT